MAYVATPFTNAVRDAVVRGWGPHDDFDSAPTRLHGGEESAAYRVGSFVVRIGPSWRSDAELEWCHAVASSAHDAVPEAVAPIAAFDGSTVARVDGRPVSLWPFVEGQWVDDDDGAQWSAVADLLARLHRRLAAVSLPARPAGRPRAAPAPVSGLGDTAELDEWIDGFLRQRPAHQPLHGDYYAGNLLARDGVLVAVLDWDEALVAPPEVELAWASWEFGDGLWADDLHDVYAFMEEYRRAGGPAERLDEESLRQLVCHRLRLELQYAAEYQSSLDADDREYHARQIEVFHRLRP